MSEARPGNKCRVSICALEKGMTDKKLSYDDLKQYTNNFSEDNFIGKFQWGKVYRGYIGEQPVVVKKWEIVSDYNCYPGENEQRIRDEILLLQQPTMSSHPNLVKLIGYCDACEEQLGVVYDVNLRDSLYNLLPQDSFTWLQRIKVILGFAHVLDFMHDENPPNLPYILRNISAAHIIVDKEYKAKLFDFGMIIGGIFHDRSIPKKPHVHGCYGYINFDPWAPGLQTSSPGCDPIYATPSPEVRGKIFMLWGVYRKCRRTSIDKVVGVFPVHFVGDAFNEEKIDWDNPTIYDWADEVYEPRKTETGLGPSKFSLVYESLQESEGFSASDGDKIESLAMSCVGDSRDRPTMKRVVEDLLKLNAAQLVRIDMLKNETFQLP